MIDFGYILIIIFELMAAVFIICGLIYIENKVKACLETINIEALNVLNNLKKARNKIENINNNLKKARKFDINEIKNAVVLVLDTVNFILLVKSLKFQNGQKLSLRNIKKFIPFSLLNKILRAVKTFV